MTRRLEWLVRTRWRRRWLVLIAVLVAVRVALPFVLRPLLASQASKRLKARVAIGDVDLSLLRGGVALDDVTVRAAAVPPDASSTAAPDTPPLIAWRRFAVELRWLPLFRRTIQLREVVLDSPHVDLERLKNGELNLAALLPAQPAAGNPPPPASPSRWGFGVDRIVLRGGAVRFDDLSVKEFEPVELSLDSIVVTDLALRPGVYGAPARAHVELQVGDATLFIDARLAMRDQGIALETDLSARQFPLHRARVYIPNVGWTDLRGELGADLHYRLESGTRNELRGSIDLDDVTVRVPGLEEAALAWKSLAVAFDPLDLAARRIALISVNLSGAAVPVLIKGPDPLPLLKGMMKSKADKAPSAPATAKESPWRWSVAALSVTNSQVHLLGESSRLPVGVALDAGNLSGEGTQAAPIKLALRIGEGSLDVDGDFHLTPIGFAGRVIMDKLDLAAPLAVVGVPGLVRSSRLGGDVAFTVGSAAPTPGDFTLKGKLSLADVQVAKGDQLAVGMRQLDVTLDDLQLSGALADRSRVPAPSGDLTLQGQITLTAPQVTAGNAKQLTVGAQSLTLGIDQLTLAGALANRAATPPSGDFTLRGKLAVGDLEVAGADAKQFAVGAQTIDVAMDSITVPHLLAASPPDAAPAPIAIRLGALRIASPTVQLTRAKDGIVLPRLGEGGAAAPPPAQPAANPGVELAVGTFQLSNGRIAVTDRTVQPFYKGELSALNVDLRDARFPQLAVKRLDVAATTAPQGTIKISGGMSPTDGKFTVLGQEISLLPFNPYATAFSPYSIASGSLSIDTTASFASARYDADSSITLHSFDVAGEAGESLFQQQFGIPLSLALALLRDIHGNITLDVPVQSDASGTTVEVLTVVRGALQHAIVNALASPLKLFGAVMHNGKVEAIAPQAIAFRIGRAEVAPEATAQLEQLAAFLTSRPAIAVTLQTAPSTRDARWLREQALRAELEQPQGLWGRVRTLGQHGTRDTIRKALEARADDKAGQLDADDAATLEQWLDERPAISPEQLRTLADARLAYVETFLRDQYGVGANRIARQAPSADTTDDAPTVQIEIRSASP